MKTFRRFTSSTQDLNAVAQAAGYAQACAYESSSEWHGQAVERWKSEHASHTTRSSFFSVIAAFVLVLI